MGAKDLQIAKLQRSPECRARFAGMDSSRDIFPVGDLERYVNGHYKYLYSLIDEDHLKAFSL